MFLAYAVPAKATRVLIDRELYVPRSWTGDRDLVRGDGHPRCTVFATKPQLAQKMIERAIAGALPFSWFTADEAYGDNGPLRDWLEQLRAELAGRALAELGPSDQQALAAAIPALLRLAERMESPRMEKP